MNAVAAVAMAFMTFAGQLLVIMAVGVEWGSSGSSGSSGSRGSSGGSGRSGRSGCSGCYSNL